MAVEAEDIALIHLLALAYEQTGREEEAVGMIERAEALTSVMQSSGTFLTDPDVLLLPSLNHAARGEWAKSALALRAAFDGGWRNYYAELFNPVWRGAFKSPEFKPVLADIVTAIDQQRAEVENIEAEHDFRAEFEALMKLTP